MYRPNVLACKAGVGGAGCSLAFTGFNVLTYVLAGATLFMLGVVVLHLVPRREH